MMSFDLGQAIQILERTPNALNAMLTGLSESWVSSSGDIDSWSPYDVVGHLIHGERTDWIPRARIILARTGPREFEPFDRFAQFDASEGRPLEELLGTFARLRQENLKTLQGFSLQVSDFALEGRHPELGQVTLGQLLATWVVHDLNHIAQICEALARQYTRAVGPWRAYLPIVDA